MPIMQSTACFLPDMKAHSALWSMACWMLHSVLWTAAWLHSHSALCRMLYAWITGRELLRMSADCDGDSVKCRLQSLDCLCPELEVSSYKLRCQDHYKWMTRTSSIIIKPASVNVRNGSRPLWPYMGTTSAVRTLVGTHRTRSLMLSL